MTARSIMYPSSLLFQNDGRSEISMFVMYDGEAPTNELNPFDKPAPRGCSVYETSYGPIAKADNESIMLGTNQDVKLGYFKNENYGSYWRYSNRIFGQRNRVYPC
ncbi:MAG: hypothetical protein IPL25_13150 [Saprospiraceae bacterium]|nr:hypothetical protein [Candidatus Vicinibacter affinis]